MFLVLCASPALCCLLLWEPRSARGHGDHSALSCTFEAELVWLWFQTPLLSSGSERDGLFSGAWILLSNILREKKTVTAHAVKYKLMISCWLFYTLLQPLAIISKGLLNWYNLFCFLLFFYAVELNTTFVFSSSCAALWTLPAAWLLNTTSLLTGWTYALSATWLPTTAWAPCRDSVTVLCPTATFQRYCLKKMGFRGQSGKRL